MSCTIFIEVTITSNPSPNKGTKKTENVHVAVRFEHAGPIEREKVTR